VRHFPCASDLAEAERRAHQVFKYFAIGKRAAALDEAVREGDVATGDDGKVPKRELSFVLGIRLPLVPTATICGDALILHGRQDVVDESVRRMIREDFRLWARARCEGPPLQHLTYVIFVGTG